MMAGDTRQKLFKSKKEQTCAKEAGEHSDPSLSSAELPPELRKKLSVLFGQIEREFINLYSENSQLQEKLDLLSGQVEGYMSNTICYNCNPYEKERFCSSISQPEEDLTKIKQKGSLQMAQRIKTKYKASTNKIVSSFKTNLPTTGCIPARSFNGHKDGIWDVSSSNSVVASASADRTARIWHADSGNPLVVYAGHTGSVNSVRFHPTENLAMTASGDFKVHLWKFQRPRTDSSGKSKNSSGEDEFEDSKPNSGASELEVNTIRTPLAEFIHHQEPIWAADFLAGGGQFVTACWDQVSALVDTSTATLIREFTGHEGTLTNVTTHPSSSLFLTSSHDCTFRLWDSKCPSEAVVCQAHSQSVATAVFAPNDKVVSCSDDYTIKVWDSRSLSVPIVSFRTNSGVNRLDVCWKENIIACPQDNRSVRLYDISGARLARLPRSNRQGHQRIVMCAHWVKDCNSMNLITSAFDNQILGWRIDTSLFSH